MTDPSLIARLKARIRDGEAAKRAFQDLAVAEYLAGVEAAETAERFGVSRTYAASLAWRRGKANRRQIPGPAAGPAQRRATAP